MTRANLDAIKAALKEHHSPVLFVFHPTSRDYWHADMVIGYDDARQVLIARDSSFGDKLTDIAPYDYDGKSPWGPQAYRGNFEVTYAQALEWGNHATAYFLQP
jgi:hypothetical protein